MKAADPKLPSTEEVAEHALCTDLGAPTPCGAWRRHMCKSGLHEFAARCV